jgi:aspartyl-tRNA(Asn)/glutamyl-tRNA(Gln) amidotransferase subunit A
MDLVGAAGLTLVDKPVRLSDPVKVWWSSGVVDAWTHVEEGMWPEREAEFEYYNRGSMRRSQDAPAPMIARIWMRRGRLVEELADWFSDVDVLLTPSTAVTAYVAEGPMPTNINGIDVDPAMNVPFTMLANLCWNPAISVPAGLSHDGLPVGLQIVVRRHADEVALRLARIFEQARPWPRLAPPVAP